MKNEVFIYQDSFLEKYVEQRNTKANTSTLTTLMQFFSGKTQISCLILASLVCWKWYRWDLGYLGIKTGYTTSAGGCLSSLLTVETGKY
jgi:D-alanyl-D-alanine carboxypeptidase